MDGYGGGGGLPFTGLVLAVGGYQFGVAWFMLVLAVLLVSGVMILRWKTKDARR